MLADMGLQTRPYVWKVTAIKLSHARATVCHAVIEYFLLK